MRLWVLLCGLRGALVACESLLALGIFIVQGSQGWGINQWESGVQGLVLASGFTVTTPGKITEFAKQSAALQDERMESPGVLQLCRFTPVTPSENWAPLEFWVYRGACAQCWEWAQHSQSLSKSRLCDLRPLVVFPVLGRNKPLVCPSFFGVRFAQGFQQSWEIPPAP